MTVYLLIDAWPTDLGGDWKVLGVLSTREKAEKKLARLQKQDEYKYQYLEIEPHRVY